MLHDAPIRDVPGDLPRKWMFDKNLELIVWYGSDKAQIEGFELIYDRLGADSHSIRWLEGKGLSHYPIDDGEKKPGRDRTPILSPNGPFPKERILEEFKHCSGELPSELQKLVIDHLTGYSTD